MVMKDLSTETLLNSFATNFAKGMLSRSKQPGHDVWPEPIFHPGEGLVYTVRSFLPLLYDTINKLESKNFTDYEIAKLFIMPSRIVRLTYFFPHFHLSGLSKDGRIDLAGKLLRYLSYLRSDTFCESGVNAIRSNNEINEILRNVNIVDLSNLENSDRIRSAIGKLASILTLYCELLYFSMQQFGHEYHGPYSLGDGKVLLVRKYYDLRPEFWEFSKNLPYEEITFLTIYKNVEITFDFSNRMHSVSPLGQSLSHFAILNWGYADLIEETKLEDLFRRTKEVAVSGSKYVNKIGKIELIKKFGEMFFYAIKPLRDALGEDWHPPKSFYDDVEKHELGKYVRELTEPLKQLPHLPEQKQFETLKMLFDPRSY